LGNNIIATTPSVLFLYCRDVQLDIDHIFEITITTFNKIGLRKRRLFLNLDCGENYGVLNAGSSSGFFGKKITGSNFTLHTAQNDLVKTFGGPATSISLRKSISEPTARLLACPFSAAQLP
jgi:hypothetical protein